MDQIILAWYGWLIGAAAPCQLTTNLGALAYASANPDRAWPRPLRVIAAGVLVVAGLHDTIVDWLP